MGLLLSRNCGRALRGLDCELVCEGPETPLELLLLRANGEEFGEERLKRVLREAVNLPAPEISSRISEELKHWIQGAEQYDDLTFIVMKVN